MCNIVQCQLVLCSNKQFAVILVILLLFHSSKLYVTFPVKHFWVTMRRQKLLICFLKGKMEIAKHSARAHHTLKKLISDTAACNALLKKRIKHRCLLWKYVWRWRCVSTHLKLFVVTGVPKLPKTSQWCLLMHLCKYPKPVDSTLLNPDHFPKCVFEVEKYLKFDFQCVLFMDECRATLDGPNGWWTGN